MDYNPIRDYRETREKVKEVKKKSKWHNHTFVIKSQKILINFF